MSEFVFDRRSALRWGVGAAAVALAGVGTGIGMSYFDEARIPSVSLGSGRLDLVVKPSGFREVSGDVEPAQDIDGRFPLAPGDMVEANDKFHLDLVGTNALGKLTVSAGIAGELPAGAVMSWKLLDPTGAVRGEGLSVTDGSVVIEHIAPAETGTSKDWTIVTNLSVSHKDNEPGTVPAVTYSLLFEQEK